MSITNYKSDNGVVYSCRYHIVWCPKYRRKVLVGKIETRLKELLIETCAEKDIDIIQMEIMPDHVYILLEVSPHFGLHKTVKLLKSKTSNVLRKEFKELRTKIPTLWTNSYLVSTISGTIPFDAVKQYIESQPTSQRQETPKQKRKL